LINTRLMGGPREVVGPPGTAKLVAFGEEFYAEDVAYRLRRIGRSTADFGRVTVRELSGGESLTVGGLKVTTAPVKHTVQTLAYRFEADGQSIVISGDLSYSESLVELARDGDVLVIDSGAAIQRKADADREGPRGGPPVFSDCRFVENFADYGGAMVDRVGVRSTISGCVFENNRARWRAGAVYLDYDSRPAFTDCRFTGNRSDCHGGALAAVSRASQLEATIAVLKSCTFVGNHAQRLGGALAIQSRARAVLLGCDLSGNRSDQGPADLAPGETSSVSHNQLDWPDPTAPRRPAGFGPPRR